MRTLRRQSPRWRWVGRITRACAYLSVAIACALSVVSLRAVAHAQVTPLATALAVRRPEHEIVPQACGVVNFEDGDRVCVRDEGGLVRAVRRVGLGAQIQVARRGTDLFFAVSDAEFATRFDEHAWRWDLARDEIHGLGELGHVGEDGETSTLVVATSFGVIYRTTSGLILHDGHAGHAVAVPDGFESATVFVLDDVSYGTWVGDDGVSVRALVLEGDRVRVRVLAQLPGHRVLRLGRVVVSLETQPRQTQLHFVVLPGTEVVHATIPFRDASVRVRDDGAALRLWSDRQAADVDLQSGAVTAIEHALADLPPPPVPSRQPRSIHELVAGQSEVWIRAATSRGAVLGASGVTIRRRGPRARTTCRCRGQDVVCGRDGPVVTDGCAEPGGTAEIVEPDARPTRAVPTFTGDGAFRLDLLEADQVRITRLVDGAHLWVRTFGDGAIVAQRDDGTYFVSDRALETGLALRLGRSILEAPIVPLSSRAELYRATLVADFFSGR